MVLERSHFGSRRLRQGQGQGTSLCRLSGHEYSGASTPSFASRLLTFEQWIDLPPPYHISASSSAFSHESSANPLYNLNSPPRSSPPIYKPHNKFFDTLTLADRPRSQQISGGLGRTLAGSSSASLTSLGGRGEWDSGGLGATSPAELAMELQISDSSMVSYAHYGYVVSTSSELVLLRLTRIQYCLLVGRSKERDVLISGCSSYRGLARAY